MTALDYAADNGHSEIEEILKSAKSKSKLNGAL